VVTGATPVSALTRGLLQVSLLLFLLASGIAGTVVYVLPTGPQVGLVNVAVCANLGSGASGVAGLVAGRRTLARWQLVFGWLAAGVVSVVGLAFGWVWVLVSGLPAAG